jgi:Fe-S-cluster containining protein
MTANALDFRCLRCGKCCSNLLAEHKGVVRGLTLLPDELDIFDESVVRPAIGRGERPHGRSFEVIAYQMTEEICPHLEEGLCRIYPDRPSSCRQFPFSLRRGPDGGLQMGLDLNCPGLATLIEDHPRPVIRFESKPHAERLLEVALEAMRHPQRAWFFDLRREEWVRYGDLRES